MKKILLNNSFNKNIIFTNENVNDTVLLQKKKKRTLLKSHFFNNNLISSLAPKPMKFLLYSVNFQKIS